MLAILDKYDGGRLKATASPAEKRALDDARELANRAAGYDTPPLELIEAMYRCPGTGSPPNGEEKGPSREEEEAGGQEEEIETT